MDVEAANFLRLSLTSRAFCLLKQVTGPAQVEDGRGQHTVVHVESHGLL